MREFHVDIVTQLTNASHPDVAFATLVIVRNALQDMIADREDWNPDIEGLKEARALLTNLMIELHVTYGVPTPAEEDEEDNAADL